jgi:prepilin-type N-terminal cleavage/methylation domain-containing protein
MKRRGFTLIELLVVIAIIGVLSSIVLASLDGSRKKGRDARRLSDLKQIQLALELYYDSNSAFPPGIVASDGKAYFTESLLTDSGYISMVPKDPSTGAHYVYVPYGATGSASRCSNYHLGATLESSNHAALAEDVDISSANGGKPPAGYAICTSGGAQPSNDFDGRATGASCSGSLGNAAGSGASSPVESCYDIRP